MSDTATITDARLGLRPAPGRSSRCRRRVATSGAIGWLRDKPVLQPAQHRADDRRACCCWSGSCRRCVKFLIIDAVWDGASRDRLPAAAGASRGRRLLGLRDRPDQLLHLRLLSDRGALAGRCVLRAAGVRHRLDGLARRAAPRPRRGLFLRRDADRCRSSCCSACRRSGLPQVEHRAMGRRAGDHRGGGGRHRGVAAARHRCSRSAAARRCRRCGCSR